MCPLHDISPGRRCLAAGVMGRYPVILILVCQYLRVVRPPIHLEVPQCNIYFYLLRFGGILRLAHYFQLLAMPDGQASSRPFHLPYLPRVGG